MRFDSADLFNRARFFEKTSHSIEGSQIAVQTSEVPALAIELSIDELAREDEIGAVCRCEGLGAADRQAFIAERDRVREELAIPADLHERGADCPQPCEGLERYRSCLANEDEPLEARARTIEHNRAALPAQAILNAKLPVQDAKPHAKAVHEQNAGANLQRGIKGRACRFLL